MSIDVLSNLVVTEVYSVSTLYTPKNTKVKKIDRPSWALVMKYEGETVYTSNGKRFLSDVNHVMVLPKESSYNWECTASGHYTIVEFDSALTCPTPFSVSVGNTEKISKMFRDLEYKRTLGSLTVEIESIRDVYSILLALIHNSRSQYQPTKKQERIAPAVEYILLNYNKNITNDTLAAIVGMSTVYFRKLFTGVMGVSPIVFARKVRIEKAKEMLKSDYGTLSDVSVSLGYSGLYDFSRDFKKWTGVPPSKYCSRSNN